MSLVLHTPHGIAVTRQQRGIGGGPEPLPALDDALGRIIELIPAEVIALYTAAVAIANSGASPAWWEFGVVSPTLDDPRVSAVLLLLLAAIAASITGRKELS